MDINSNETGLLNSDMSLKFIKYEGNLNYFIGLLKSNDNKLYTFYSKVSNIIINSEIDITTTTFHNVLTSTSKKQNASINIPLIIKDNGHIFTAVQIEKEEDYELIKKVVRDLI